MAANEIVRVGRQVENAQVFEPDDLQVVAMRDDLPVPKVIDIGLAKATGQQLIEKTLVTAQGRCWEPWST